MKQPWSSLLVVLCVLAVGGLVWLLWGQAVKQTGEQELDIELICAACGHTQAVTYDGLLDLMAEAKRKGLAEAGAARETPIGFCPQCGKAALFRPRECRNCGKPMAPAFVTVDGKPVEPKCKACGWSGAP